MIPDFYERAEDEFLLGMLNLWDEGWSAGHIGERYGLSRSTVLGRVWRIHQQDPDALTRKPQTKPSYTAKAKR